MEITLLQILYANKTQLAAGKPPGAFSHTPNDRNGTIRENVQTYIL
jgi:hypothetical protein